jgi:biotin synthase-related radical SAM superfamily protein
MSTLSGTWVFFRGMSENVADIGAAFRARADFDLLVQSGEDEQDRIELCSRVSLLDARYGFLMFSDHLGELLLRQILSGASVLDEGAQL